MILNSLEKIVNPSCFVCLCCCHSYPGKLFIWQELANLCNIVICYAAMFNFQTLVDAIITTKDSILGVNSLLPVCLGFFHLSYITLDLKNFNQSCKFCIANHWICQIKIWHAGTCFNQIQKEIFRNFMYGLPEDFLSNGKKKLMDPDRHADRLPSGS